MNSDVAIHAFKLLSQPATAQEGLRILEAEADRLPDSAKALFDLACANDMIARWRPMLSISGSGRSGWSRCRRTINHDGTSRPEAPFGFSVASISPAQF
jgi:hypothetical protein